MRTRCRAPQLWACQPLCAHTEQRWPAAEEATGALPWRGGADGDAARPAARGARRAGALR
eukprot:3429858-Prymnesium_polylepis.2